MIDGYPIVFVVGAASGAMLAYLISWWIGHGICG